MRQFPRDFPNEPPYGFSCAVYLNGRKVTKGRLACVFADEQTGEIHVALRDRLGRFMVDGRNRSFVWHRIIGGEVKIIDWDYSKGKPPNQLPK